MKIMKNTKTIFPFFLSFLFFSFTGFSQSAKKEAEIKKCLIVSDIHFDPLFGAHNDTALYKKLKGASFEEWKKSFEASKQQTTVNNTLFFRDANYGVLQSALANMKKRLPHPAFIIIAGDFIWHGAKPVDSVLKKKTIRFIAQLFKKNFPGAPIISTMGNNDTYNNDYEIQDSRFLNDFAEAWSPNLPKASADQLKAQGYYTFTTGNLDLVVLNSTLVRSGSRYPQGPVMLNWLQSTLANTGKKVWIIAHIPPGTNVYNGTGFWNANYTQTFVDEVVKYSPKINLMITSHTHFNDFTVFYNSANAPVSYLRTIPSICSNHGNNPSFDVAEFNDATGRMEKETSYYLNLIAVPKEANYTNLDWNDTISLPSLLNMNKIDAENFSKFIDNVRTDQSGQALDRYKKFYTVGTKVDSSIRINKVNYMKYLKADSLKGK
jgi:hypothetical protein